MNNSFYHLDFSVGCIQKIFNNQMQQVKFELKGLKELEPILTSIDEMYILIHSNETNFVVPCRKMTEGIVQKISELLNVHFMDNVLANKIKVLKGKLNNLKSGKKNNILRKLLIYTNFCKDIGNDGAHFAEQGLGVDVFDNVAALTSVIKMCQLLIMYVNTKEEFQSAPNVVKFNQKDKNKDIPPKKRNQKNTNKNNQRNKKAQNPSNASNNKKGANAFPFNSAYVPPLKPGEVFDLVEEKDMKVEPSAENVQSLLDMGFSNENVFKALDIHNDNLELATEYLLNSGV